MALTTPKFILRDYERRDFDALFKLDRLCFDPGIAYSRPELASFIEQRRAFTVVAEWNDAPEESASAESGSADAPVEDPADGSVDGSATPSVMVEPAKPAIAKQALLRTGTQRRPIAGFVTFHYQRQGYGHIITIDVHPDARRHRLGTELIQATCERLRKMTAFMVVLEVAVNNHGALAFYDRHGFKRVKVLERYYNRDVDAIFMTKRL